MQILQPLPNQPFGPGFLWTVQTDFIGPIELGSFYELTTFPQTGETTIGKALKESQQSLEIGVLGELNVSSGVTWRFDPQVSVAPDGSPARLQAQLMSPSSVILDTTTIPIVWNLQASPYVLSQLPTATAPAGGFVQADRDSLNLVLGAVRTVLPPALAGGGNIAMQVIDLVRGPPRSLLRRFGSAVISGRGALSAVPPGGLHSFGGTWTIQTVPPRLGLDDGVVTEFHRRLAQFVVLRDEVTSDLYIDVLEDSHWHENFILWQFPNPVQIQYDVAPGVVLVWNWLV
jgi:hypothetical protein